MCETQDDDAGGPRPRPKSALQRIGTRIATMLTLDEWSLDDGELRNWYCCIHRDCHMGSLSNVYPELVAKTNSKQ